MSIDYCKTTWAGYLLCPITGSLTQGIVQNLPGISPEVITTFTKELISSLGTVISQASDDIGEVLANAFNTQTNTFLNTANFTQVTGRAASDVGQALHGGATQFFNEVNITKLTSHAMFEAEGAAKIASKTFEKVAGDAIEAGGRLAAKSAMTFLPLAVLGIVSLYSVPYVIKYIYQRVEKNLSRPKLASEVKYEGIVDRVKDTAITVISNTYNVLVPTVKTLFMVKMVLLANAPAIITASNAYGFIADSKIPYISKLCLNIRNFIPQGLVDFAQGLGKEMGFLLQGEQASHALFLHPSSLTSEGLKISRRVPDKDWWNPASYQLTPLPNMQLAERIAFGAAGVVACLAIYQIFQKYMAGKQEPKAIFNQELTEVIDDLTAATYNIKNNGGYFQNVLLYGPGGTGKTMVAKIIAKNSGMNYIMMSGGSLAQHIKNKDHVTELNNLISKAKNSSNPTILFIDEAESMLKKRDLLTSMEHLELQNAFLGHTGEPDKKLMIILATNRLADIDDAVLSRMDHKLHIAPPEVAERKKILDQYISVFFKDAKERTAIFTEEKVQKMADKMDGFTGRTIFKLLNAISGKKSAVKDNKLTIQMVDSTLDRFIRQEQEVLEIRAQRKKEIPVIVPISVGQQMYDKLSQFAARFFAALPKLVLPKLVLPKLTLPKLALPKWPSSRNDNSTPAS